MEIENLRLQSEIDSIIDKIYPIGSIYMSISPTNPEETIGGAWVPWGQGKVPVGVDTSDSDFNSVEKTGGEKRHTLINNEIPNHFHVLGYDVRRDATSFANSGSLALCARWRCERCSTTD